MEKESETPTNKQKMPFLGGKQCFSIKNKERKGKNKKQKRQRKRQIRRVEGQVRWPFRPPHLTLKPSKKKPKNKKKQKQIRRV